MKVNPCLNYGGNGEEAFRFYEQHLGGKVTFLRMRGQAATPSNIPDNGKKKSSTPI